MDKEVFRNFGILRENLSVKRIERLQKTLGGILLKRVLVCLLVVCMFVLVGGAAFAAPASNNLTQLPYSPGNYPLGAVMENLMADGVLTTEQYNAFWGLIDYWGINTVEAWRVTVTLGLDGTATIPWGNNQYIYDFSSRQFISYSNIQGASDVTAMAPRTYVLRKNSDISDQTLEDLDKARYLSIIDAKGGGGDKKGSGGGCSALTLGAVALFLIPAFAVVKKGRK